MKIDTIWISKVHLYLQVISTLSIILLYLGFYFAKDESIKNTGILALYIFTSLRDSISNMDI